MQKPVTQPASTAYTPLPPIASQTPELQIFRNTPLPAIKDYNQDENSLESILRRQEEKLQRQAEEMRQLKAKLSQNNQISNDQYLSKTTSNFYKPLSSTSTQMPVAAADLESSLVQSLSQASISVKQNALTPLPSIIPSIPKEVAAENAGFIGERPPSGTSTLDLEALDRLNQARLKRLTQMDDNGSHESLTSKGNARPDSFISRLIKNAANPSSADSLITHTQMKP